MNDGERIRTLVEACRDTLVSAGIKTEAVGEYEGPKRRFLIKRPARIVSVTRAWRLGVLLIDESGELRVAGSTLRAHEPPPILGYASLSARQRDELRHAAIRGGFAEGEIVHYGTHVIDGNFGRGDSGPISLLDGVPVVKWHPNATLNSAIPLEQYLHERVKLLTDPPQGAS